MALSPTTSRGATGAASALTLLSTTTVGAASTIDVSGIDQTYNDLVLVVIAQSSAAIASDSVGVTFNGDGAGNYYDDMVRSNGAVVSAVQLLANTSTTPHFTCPAASGIAGAFGFFSMEILGYRVTTWRKGLLSHTGGNPARTTNNTVPQVSFGWWDSTAAINRITLTPGTTPFTFATGSFMRIYGRM